MTFIKTMGTNMTYFINLKKLGVKSTVLASSIALVACGGGGSDGYYNTFNRCYWIIQCVKSI